jgi:hypothetical protein
MESPDSMSHQLVSFFYFVKKRFPSPVGLKIDILALLLQDQVPVALIHDN